MFSILAYWAVTLFVSIGLGQQHPRLGREAAADQSIVDSDGFKSIVNATMEQFSIPGLAIGIVTPDGTQFAGYGVMDENGKPVTPEVRFLFRTPVERTREH